MPTERHPEAFGRPDDGAGEARHRRERLFVPWLVLCALCLWWMWAVPGEKVVPFHLIWIGFALAYGFEAWPLRRTVIALAVVGIAGGAQLVARARSGQDSWDETFEIPLMLALSGLVLWHVQRRERALHAVNSLARRRSAESARRERFGRLTAHEIRTPLTIATGYLDLMTMQETDPERLSDLEIVKDELARLGRTTDRLLRMIQLNEHLPRSWVDVDQLLWDVSQRWSSVATRQWKVETGAGRLLVSPERLRACLDTLVENALRYTGVDDTVRLFAATRGTSVLIGVADSGPGLDEQRSAEINSGVKVSAPGPADRSPDPLSQTGLGIGLVREILQARDGRLAAGRSREGGALFVLCMPRRREAARSLR